MLTFPGIFSPSGLLGAGPQTTSWLYCFWHGGFALIVLAFVILRRRAPHARAAGRGAPILAAIAATAAAAAAVVILATAGQDYLTPIIEQGDYTMLVTKGVSPTMCAICVVSLVLLLPRLRASALDLWLGVVMTAWLCDVLLAAVVGASRFDLGWYGGRMFGLFATIVLLMLLLIEFNKLDERLEARTAELRASRALIERFFENSAECFAIMLQAEGEQFRYEEINPATLALYGKQRSEVLGRTTVEVLGEPSATQLNAHLASVRGVASAAALRARSRRPDHRSAGDARARGGRAPAADHYQRARHHRTPKSRGTAPTIPQNGGDRAVDREASRTTSTTCSPS